MPTQSLKFLDADEKLAMLDIIRGLEQIGSKHADTIADLYEQIETLRMCESCGNWGLHVGSKCGPCCTLEDMGA
jgi:hypothetical protein